jgi:23S rRNA (pseudouridine1915-N3)-methyltransferase
MKVALIAVGKVRSLFAAPVAEYEKRLRRYHSFEAIEVREQPSHKASGPEQVKDEEGKRILARVPPGYELVALHREGESWNSTRLSLYLSELALQSRAGLAFVIGGAFGLSDEVLRRSDRKLSISAFTLPHEMARLVITEQLYRAGTIARGEPYHKGGGV